RLLTSSGPKISWTTTTPGSLSSPGGRTAYPCRCGEPPGAARSAERSTIVPIGASVMRRPNHRSRWSHPDGQRRGVPGRGVAGHRRDRVDARVVAEDVVALQRHLREVADTRRVAVRRVDGVTGLLRQRDLGGLDDRPGRGRVGDAGVDLEVDVRPAARVAGREDRREGDRPGRVRLLDAAKIVLPGDGARVERVLALAVAVPQVDRGPGLGRPGRSVAAGELDGQRDAGRGRLRRADAGPDVGAHDAGVVEDVDAV